MTDVQGASDTPVKFAGDIVLARWHDGTAPFTTGWLLHGVGFGCILNEPDVEVLSG